MGDLAHEQFTIGVEEEFFLVAAEGGELAPDAELVLAAADHRREDQVHAELQRYQIETGTKVCRTLAEVRGDLVHLRRALASAARRAGLGLASAGAHPFSHAAPPVMTPKPAYLALEREYRQVASEHLVCGCHVHVGVNDSDMAIEILNRTRPWLPVLLALSGNSPFWWGNDTGYSSFRNQMWRRWPISGIPQLFDSRGHYDDEVETLQATRSIDDPARLYWDIRPSSRYPTLELRVSDACLTVDDAVMIAGLARAFVRACHDEAVRDSPVPRPAADLLRAATWRAARYGLDGDLVDVVAGRAVPAAEMVATFMGFLRPVLEDAGDWDEVSNAVERTMRRGTGAARQREVFSRSRRLDEVVAFVVAETAPG